MILARPGPLLRLEGGAVFLLALWLFARADGSWMLFTLLLLAPDLSILGYRAGSRAGAAIYNLVHTYALPALLGAAGVVGESRLALHLALIWAAHIGADRMLGFGLKYPTAFKDTHLRRV